MSVCQQAIRRRSNARVNRPKGLRADGSKTTKSLLVNNLAGKISKTARKSGAK